MPKLDKILALNRFTLMAELNTFDTDAAEAAIEAGADVILFNNGWRDYQAIKTCKKCVDIPFGISIKNPQKIKTQDLEKLAACGADFISFPAESLPAGADKIRKLSKVQELGEDYTLDQLLSFPEENAQALSAGIIPKTEWGKDLTIGDMQNIISICISSNLPVLVPTQKKIRASEVSIIWDAGAKGLILTAAFLPTALEGMTKAIREYRYAVDDLGDQ